ncbi:ankyrin and armadillo repeat-containing protein [Petromyzon marinus]|uniref:ankyrin and armadillo repeat-containing protein n=1 Tax=Petromyzon marinus TaxID=7757 RepID=UPI003F706B4A
MWTETPPSLCVCVGRERGGDESRALECWSAHGVALSVPPATSQFVLRACETDSVSMEVEAPAPRRRPSSRVTRGGGNRPLTLAATASASRTANKEDEKTAYLAKVAAQQDASSFVERLSRGEQQELLAGVACGWLPAGDDTRPNREAPAGIVSQMTGIGASTEILQLLWPLRKDGPPPLDAREVHQMVRELTLGLYGLNQAPGVSMEPAIDRSTVCQLPPAYVHTRVGQVLAEVDYTLKALWHGAHMGREKRVRFGEYWRAGLELDSMRRTQEDKDILQDFTSAGMIDVAKDPDWAGIYEDDGVADPSYEVNSADERLLFTEHSEGAWLGLVVAVASVAQHHGLFVCEPRWDVDGGLRPSDEQAEPPPRIRRRLQRRLATHRRLMRAHLPRKAETRTLLDQLGLVACLTPILLALKRRMKVPNLGRLLPPLTEEKLKTESEFPPLVLGPDFACRHFLYEEQSYFHLHGSVQLDLSTPPLGNIDPDIAGRYAEIQHSGSSHLLQMLDPDAPYRESHPFPTIVVGDETYQVISVPLEPFSPHMGRPWWCGALRQLVDSLRLRRLPLSDVIIHEQFKQRFGYRRAIRYKSVPVGLRAATQGGLVAAFLSLSRREVASRLGTLDERGLALVHHAAMHNRPPMLSLLANAGADLQAPSRSEGPDPRLNGPAPIHLAAQHGSLEALGCLLALRVDPALAEGHGWTAAHFAAAHDHEPVIRALHHHDPALLTARATTPPRSTPVLVAAAHGSLDTLRCLLALGAEATGADDCGKTAAHVAVAGLHTDVLQHLARLQLPELPVWALLVGMLGDENIEKVEMTARCLEVLCVSRDRYEHRTDNWRHLLEAGGMPELVRLLDSESETVTCLAASVICNVSDHGEACDAAVAAGAIPVLVRLLGSTARGELQSRCAVVLGDAAALGHRDAIAREKGIAALVRLTQRCSLEGVLVNVVDTVRVMCDGDPSCQVAVVREGGIGPLVEFLGLDSDSLQAAAALALATVTRAHEGNQAAAAAGGALAALARLVCSRRTEEQVRAAVALQALCDGNPGIQRDFLALSVTQPLLRLLKVFQLEVREHGALALWALAGGTQHQQAAVVLQVGLRLIIDMLLASSDKLQFVGCHAMAAMAREGRAHQEQICREDGVAPLVRLLRTPRTTERTLLATVSALGALCVGVAHVNTRLSQNKVEEEQAIPELLRLLSTHANPNIKVEAACTLAYVLLKNHEVQEKMMEKDGFNYDVILELLEHPDRAVRLRAGYALAVFAYNNREQQATLAQAGRIAVSDLLPFLESENEHEQAQAAFQMVVLSGVFRDGEQVPLTAQGLSVLVGLLSSSNLDSIVLASELLASLAHTRAGLPIAMVTLGAMEMLTEHLFSSADTVREAAAVALGYLSFNREAHRMLLVSCRCRPGLYRQLMSSLGPDARISPDFMADFERQQLIGLPALSLEIYGGPKVIPNNHKGRAKTAVGPRYKADGSPERRTPRAISAPAKLALQPSRGTSLRAKSAAPRAHPASAALGGRNMRPLSRLSQI